ncbi:MAG: hypothetical protein AAF933_16675, partial [Pseudomonadota bacterium]
ATICRSALDPSLQAACLTQALTGAASVAFFDMHGRVDASQWTLDQACEAVVGLVPDSRAHFTTAALDLVFHKRDLNDAIRQYATYLRRGELDPDGQVWLYQRLKDRLLAAEPELFNGTAVRHNIPLDIRRPDGTVRDFDGFVADAQRLVRLWKEDRSRRPRTPLVPEEDRTPGVQLKPIDKRRKKKQQQPQGGSGAGSGSQAGGTPSDLQLLRTHNRCTKCAARLGKSGTEQEHVAKGYCEPSRLQRILRRIKEDLAAGKDPNAFVSFKGTGGQGSGKQGPPGPPAK